MARIKGVPEQRAGLFTRLAYWGARRRLKVVPEPMQIMAHQPGVLRAYLAFELGIERCHAAPSRLKELGALKAATLVGCPW